MSRTVAQKMGIIPGSRAFLAGAPDTALTAMSLPQLDVATTLAGTFSYLHLFTTSQNELDAEFPQLREHLASRGALWVSWPKARQRGTDLTLPKVIRICYAHSMVESTCLSIDATWSALKFTHPKPGTVYNNSYGQLPIVNAPVTGS